ncbi:fungal-specific transcription factor [Xylariomycetidae sp. FL2044]|nr:fungal-specific transcription factor [Xylariomycetidae sp. FL2044]
MFQTFNSAMTDVASSRRTQGRAAGSSQRGHGSTRSLHAQTFRACKRCRIYHIKCGEKPCEPCRANNAKCVWRRESTTAGPHTMGSPTSPTRRMPSTPSAIDKGPPGPSSHMAATMINYGRGLEGTAGTNLPTANNITNTAHGNDSSNASSASTPESGRGESTIYTPSLESPPTSQANKVRQLFRDLTPAMGSEDSPPNPFPALPQSSSHRGAHGDLVDQGVEPLNRDKQAYFVRLFWTSLGPLFPIMANPEFEALFTANWTEMFDRDTIEGAMVNGMTALGIQCGQSAGVGGRILGADSDTDRRGSLKYYRCCRDRLRAESHRVNVTSIRCYILLALYELQANRVESAYYIAGLGVRRAHMSRLHLAPPAHVTEPEAQGRVRTWWLLYWIDLHCSMQLDRPAAVHRSSITCPATFSPIQRQDHDFTTYSNALSKLTDSIAESLGALPTIQSVVEGDLSSRHEESAERLFYTMRSLAAFLSSLPRELLNPRESAGSGYSTPTEGRENSGLHHVPDYLQPGGASVALVLGVPDWLQRQRILLELQYHNACVLLQRPFILWQQAPGGSPTSATLPRTKYHADYAVQHANSIITILYSIYCKSDILDGLTMVFQYLWNAITTLAVQYYLDAKSLQSVGLLDSLSRVLAILESISRANPEALHVYQVTHALISRLQDTPETGILHTATVPWPDIDIMAPVSTDNLLATTFSTDANGFHTFTGDDFMIQGFDVNNFDTFDPFEF